ncbi:class I SAM-dependent methyltransferase [uncultured Aquimarina sp.]|uniref:class I SAM-dependent methyltransferase n=1 Tax=uncultured Aquimarina sp. TaxID=575652 RepID=UPI0026128BE6|nr:class I SAM-dependent methyltransferase [uncultured Aquimarina sp.]
MIEEMYQEKEHSYFSNVRSDIIHFVKDEKDLKVLEVGGGKGNTLLYLKKKEIASEIHMIDIIDLVEDKEKFNSVHILDIEESNLTNIGKFDVIILADVLEHLKDPDNVVSKLKKLLSKNGFFLVSIPNIRHYSALIKIYLKGSFRYEEEGIFDKTHIRFFCKSDMIRLFSGNEDLKIEKILPNNKILRSKATLINKLTFGMFTQFFTVQYLFKINRVS